MASIDKDNYEKFLSLGLQSFFDVAILMQGKAGEFDLDSLKMISALEAAGIPRSDVIIFRDSAMRKVEASSVGKYAICLTEQKSFKNITCGACRLCYDRGFPKEKGRVARELEFAV